MTFHQVYLLQLLNCANVLKCTRGIKEQLLYSSSCAHKAAEPDLMNAPLHKFVYEMLPPGTRVKRKETQVHIYTK